MPNEKIERVITFVKETAEKFGGTPGSYVFRNSTQNGPDDENHACFGFVQPDEDPSGAYHDFSLVVFPGGEDQKWVVGLVVGSSGFKNDYELATFPGLRRRFARIVDDKDGFCKSDFSDIETKLPIAFARRSDLRHLSNAIDHYSKFFSACQIVEDPESDDGRRVISAFLAAYAKTRNWPSDQERRSAVESAYRASSSLKVENSVEDVKALLKERRFVVLQGAPGTGKTRTAKLVAESFKGKVFFTQFHAETSYSDFVYGISPDTESSGLSYYKKSGVFVRSLRFALENHYIDTVLIIDEINRSNLSNVLGPVFYLFEHKMESSDIEIEIFPRFAITELPKNFYVIGTMNTADRSLAVVDFALRRRFAWQTLRPAPIDSDEFFKEDFDAFDEIFSWYASSDELNLQPGQGYFLASTAEEMTNRIRYELYPLINEYLQEGLLRSAKEEFDSYFQKRINQSLFE
jgi:MoxR-like ATPase